MIGNAITNQTMKNIGSNKYSASFDIIFEFKLRTMVFKSSIQTFQTDISLKSFIILPLMVVFFLMYAFIIERSVLFPIKIIKHTAPFIGHTENSEKLQNNNAT